MNIEKHLRQLNKIQPDQAYARDSRTRLIMAAAQQPQRLTFRVFMASTMRSGFAMTAMGLLLFFAIGGSVWNLIFSPVTGWDSKALLAEAQAINSQIHLADLQYSDPGYERQRLVSPKTDLNSIAIITGPEDSDLPISTPPEAATPSSTDPVADDGANATSTPAEAGDGASPTSTPAEPEDTTVDVEEALDILSR